MTSDIERQFVYNAWANRTTLTSLRTVAQPSDRLRGLFAHILAAERIWLGRVLGNDWAQTEIWPKWSIDDSSRRIEENEVAYLTFLRSVPSSEGDTLIAYRNQTGAAFQTSLKDILQHVALHGHYHRGQIASAVKAEGGEPATTDFIVFVREEDAAQALRNRP
jgi:uncharacterized damage-inducible protein DinB